MAKTRNMTYSIRVKMQVLHEDGCSYRQISTRCGYRYTTARIIIKWFQQSGSLKDKPRIGRPRCSTARDDRVLLRLWKQFQKWSNSGRSSYRSSVQTELFVIDFWNMVSSRVLQAKQIIDNGETKKSQTSVDEEHRQWTQAHWKKIIWSDESRFQLYPTRANVRVRRRRGEEFVSACTVATVKHGGASIMVWRCMSAAGAEQLILCEGTMNSPNYCKILEHQMLPLSQALFTRRLAQHWIFQQDNAPCYTARHNKTWMNEHGAQLLDWPAQSPDMSLIENLWHIIKAAVSERKPRNMQDPRRFVVDEWNNIKPEQCKRLVENMPKIIQTLVRAHRLATKYWLMKYPKNALFNSYSLWFAIHGDYFSCLLSH